MVAHSSLVTPPIGATVAEAEVIARSQFGIDGAAVALGGERDDNFRIDSEAGTFALQIANPAQVAAEVEMQQRCLHHIAATDSDLPIPHPIAALDGELVTTATVGDTPCVVRVVTFLHGAGRESATPTGQRNLGRLAARLDMAMLDFDDPLLDREFTWDVARVGATRSLTRYLDTEQRDLVLPWFDHFDDHTGPRLSGLPRQAIHADINQTNVVWDDIEVDEITGVFDFGDMVRSVRIIEPTLAAAYQCMGQADPVAVIARVITGYHEVSALSGSEIGLVPDLVMARFVQSLVIGAWRAELHPANRDYILSDSAGSWTALQQLHEIGTDRIREAVQAECDAGRSGD